MNASSESLSLGWISLDLDEHIDTARSLFESFIGDSEESRDPQKLLSAREQLNCCAKIFESAGLQAASLYTVELGDLVKAVQDSVVSSQHDGYQAVIGGLNQLLNYLAAVKSTGDEQPAILLGVLNDVRMTCGKSMTLPQELFALQVPAAYTGDLTPGESRSMLDDNAIEKLSGVRKALEKISEDPDDQRQSLANLQQLFAGLVRNCSSQENTSLLVDLFMACEVAVGAAQQNGKRLSLSVKYALWKVVDLLQHTDRGQQYPEALTEVLTELLFCVALNADNSESARLLYNKHSLANAINIDDTSKLLRLGTPDVETMDTVLGGLIEDIAVLQNALQSCADAGGDVADCGDLHLMAANLQYTTQLAQLYELSASMAAIAEQLKSVQVVGLASHEQLESIAGKLFGVDLSLKNLRSGGGRDDSELTALEQLKSVLLNIGRAVAQCAEAVISSPADTQQLFDEQLAGVPGDLKEVNGAAAFIQSEKLALALAQLSEFFEQRVNTLLAAAEYEAVQTACMQMTRALEPLIAYVDAIKHSKHALVDNLIVAASHELTGGNCNLNLVQESVVDESTSAAVETDDLQAGGDDPAAANAPIEKSLEGEFDDEIVEIFLEEAEEVLEAIDQNYVSWADTKAIDDSLTEIRRAYHTLKGSGRMAGAEHVGETAWAVENMLNRVIDKAVPLDEQRIALVGEANEYMPLAINYFKRRVEPYLPAMESLIARAELLTNDASASVSIGESLALESGKQSQADDASVAANVHDALDTHEVSVTQDVLGETYAPDAIADDSQKDFDDVSTVAVEQGDSATESTEDNSESALEEIELQQPANSEASDLEQIELDAIASILEPGDPLSESTAVQENAVDSSSQEAIDSNKVELDHIGSEVTEPEQIQSEQDVQNSNPVTVGIDQLVNNIDAGFVLKDEPALPEEENSSVEENTGAEQDDLRAIFIEEAAIQHSILQHYIDSQAVNEPAIPDENVERAFHTLAGGARIAGVQPVADVMAPAEVLTSQVRRQTSISQAQFQILQEACSWLQSYLAEPQAAESASEELVEILGQQVASGFEQQETATPNNLGQLLSDCKLILDAQHFLLQWRVLGSAPDQYSSMVDEISQVQASCPGSQAIQELCAILRRAYPCFAEHGLNIHAYQGLLEAHSNLENMLDRLAAGQEPESSVVVSQLTELVEREQSMAEEAASLREAQRLNSANKSDLVDDEIVGIFLEESQDLVEEVERSVTSWLANRSDMSYLQTLLRPLHTIKGGARMAGLEEVGDLCHEFETLLQTAKNSKDKVTASFFKKVSKYLSELTNIFSDIQVGGNDTADVPEDNSAAADEKRVVEMIRVPADLLEKLVNMAGETSISRSLVEEQVNEFSHAIDEIGVTVERLKEQLRRLEIETEAQINFRREQVEIEGQEEFDPLEMDRYSQLQQLSKSLVESASDLKDLKGTLGDKTRDIETLLIQQGRINTELQEGLMSTRTVPLSRTIVPRLRRTIRQVSGELDKPVTFEVGNTDGELDRSVIERMVAPLEHVLRNAIDHGIESTEQRQALGKSESGAIRLDIHREGSDVVLKISDDGKGIDTEAVKAKAVSMELIDADADLTDEDINKLIFSPGFSTAKKVTQISGRGVGMDVVQSEIRELGGSVELISTAKEGSTFIFRLPFTVSMNRALLVSAGGESLAIPLNSIEGIVRVSPYELDEYYGDQAVDFMYAGQRYDFRYLGTMVNGSQPQYSADIVGALPVLLVRSGDNLVAVQVDRLLGSREIVVKSLGPQFSDLPGVAGATVLGDGSVVMIADLSEMVKFDIALATLAQQGNSSADMQRERAVAMVVDDSVTVRKVTTRLLERHGFDVVTAKDGLDAMEKLEDIKPDFMLLDIEMPRLDGFEVVSRIRHDERLLDLPIIMITSRTGDKHRERALALGANEFLGKPYQDQVLLEKIAEVAPQLPGQQALNG